MGALGLTLLLLLMSSLGSSSASAAHLLAAWHWGKRKTRE